MWLKNDVSILLNHCCLFQVIGLFFSAGTRGALGDLHAQSPAISAFGQTRSHGYEGSGDLFGELELDCNFLIAIAKKIWFGLKVE